MSNWNWDIWRETLQGWKEGFGLLLSKYMFLKKKLNKHAITNISKLFLIYISNLWHTSEVHQHTLTVVLLLLLLILRARRRRNFLDRSLPNVGCHRLSPQGYTLRAGLQAAAARHARPRRQQPWKGKGLKYTETAFRLPHALLVWGGSAGTQTVPPPLPSSFESARSHSARL